MSHDDVLFGYRLQLFDLAGRTLVQPACRTFGVHPLQLLPPGRRRSTATLECCARASGGGRRCPTSCPCSSRSGSSPSRSAIPSAPNNSGSALPRPLSAGSSSCQRRLALPAPARTETCARSDSDADRRLPAPYEPPREPQPEPHHLDSCRPGQLIGIDCFYVGRLGSPPARSATDRDRRPLLLRLGGARRSGAGNPPRPGLDDARPRRSRAHPGRRRLERVLADNGRDSEGGLQHHDRAARREDQQHHAGRPQTNGHVEHCTQTILEESGAPLLPATSIPARLQRELDRYLAYYHFDDRVDDGRRRPRPTPADIV